MEAVLRFQSRIERVSRDIEGVKAGHAGEGSGELIAEMFVFQKCIANFFGEDGCAGVVWRALRQGEDELYVIMTLLESFIGGSQNVVQIATFIIAGTAAIEANNERFA